MREVYALIYEAHSDDDRLLGVYSSVASAQYAWENFHNPGPFYRIERREIGAEACEFVPSFLVQEK